MRGRIRREHILEILSGRNPEIGLSGLNGESPKKVVNALFPLLYSQDETVKWRAVVLMGVLVRDMASKEMESARDVLRRLMWNLNDESGGIGLGSPEAMGEIMSRHEGLAEEFAPILFSYAHMDGNYLEMPMLQRGLLWSIARFLRAMPHLVKDSRDHFLPYLQSEDSAVRGHAARIMGLIGRAEDKRRLLPLLKDSAGYATFEDGRCAQRLVSETAQEALLRLQNRK